MNDKKNGALLLCLPLCGAWLSSCSQKKDCATTIQEDIRSGVSVEVAETKLKECGFKTTYDPAKNMLYGDKVKEGSPVAERTQVVITIDSEKKVTRVVASRGLIGP